MNLVDYLYVGAWMREGMDLVSLRYRGCMNQGIPIGNNY